MEGHMSLITTQMLNGFGRSFSRLYSNVAIEMNVERQVPLPAGAKIIAANHPTTTDPFIMMGLTDEPIYILITNMCFQMPVLGRFLQGAGHIPVLARNGRAAFDAAAELLKEGKTVGIFPEGALSPLEGGACPAHTGVARLALAGGAPVIPVGIALQTEHIIFKEARGGDKVETARIYLGGPYAMTTGLPLHFDGDIEDRPYVQAATRRIMDAIMNLTQISALRMRTTLAPQGGVALQPAFGRI
jgi:1-acyl-sn-glycerol-3-phosphate acyltransferase